MGMSAMLSRCSRGSVRASVVALALAVLGGLWLCLWQRPWRWPAAGVIAEAMVALVNFFENN